nr:DUF4124 domain-containing protein [Rhodoferax sp.]
MKPSGFLLILLCLALPAQAQLYKWVDANGKVQYSDKPPPAGAKAGSVQNRTSSVSGTSDNAASGVKAAAKGDAKSAGAEKSSKPLTAAEQEQAFRKRKLDETESQKKAQDKQDQEAQKQENCTTVKNQVTTLEAGGRQQRLDSKGERYFLDEQQINAELAKARQQVNTFCN